MNENSMNTGGDRDKMFSFEEAEPDLSAAIDLFNTETPGGGIGISFSHFVEMASLYREVKRREERSFDEDDLLHPEDIADPIRRKRAEMLSAIADDEELRAFAAFKLDPEDEDEHELTIGYNVDLIIEEARERSVEFKRVIADTVGDKTETKREDPGHSPIEGIWMIQKKADGPFPQISNEWASGRVKVGDLGADQRTLQDVDALHPDYIGLQDLRETIVGEVTSQWVMRKDHPWYRWALLQRCVEFGSNLALYGLVANDPDMLAEFLKEESLDDEANQARRERFEAYLERLEPSRLALREMSSRNNHDRLYDHPSEYEILDAVAETVSMLRRDKSKAHTSISPETLKSWHEAQPITKEPLDDEARAKPIPIVPLPEDRELQNLSRIKLRLTDEFPLLKPNLFAVEAAIRKETGGPSCGETLVTGPDAFEAVLAGFLPTLRVAASHIKRVSLIEKQVSSMDWDSWGKAA